jgi:cytochrome P450
MASSEIPHFQTAHTLLSFVVAVLLRPEIQKMAQEELDTVTRRERLPTFEDRPKLPFVDAVCMEVIRWRPVTPLGELLLSAEHSPHPCGNLTIHRCTQRNYKR